MKDTNLSNNIKGSKFEGQVGTYYQTLGYRVTYNVSINGQQIDILAEKMVAGAGNTKIAVECKYVEKGNLTNQKVQEFAHTGASIFVGSGITKFVLVTNNGFTKDANSVIRNNQFLELMTLRSLEDQLFELANTYRSFTETYEASEIYDEYIELNGLYLESETLNKPIKDVENFLMNWLNEPKDRFLTIFGDFGSGKTTILNRIKYRLAKAYVEGQSTLKPLLINLKDFYKYDTIDKLLAFSALREFERELSLQFIYRQIKSGSIILLLDGFDEMAQLVDVDVRMQNFLYLAPLLNTQAILSCRPSYFVSMSEYKVYANRMSDRMYMSQDSNTGNKFTEQRQAMNELGAFLNLQFLSPKILGSLKSLEHETVQIEVLNVESVDIYLEKHNELFLKKTGHDWHYVKDFLSTIYDISDLMTRPMLLKMIVVTILSGKIKLSKKQADIGPGVLYEKYTSLYMSMDYDKGESRKLFTDKQRAVFATSVAMLMFEKQVLEVSYYQLLAYIVDNNYLHEKINNISTLNYEQIVADIQICTFLVSAGGDRFKFAHKSFMEFFVAHYFRQRLKKGDRPVDFFELLPKEVLYFLGSFLVVDNLEKHVLEWFQDGLTALDRPNLTRNLAAMILYSAQTVSDLNWHDITISFIEFKRKALLNAHFHRVNIKQVSFTNSEIFNSNWVSIYLSGVKFVNSNFISTRISAVVENLQILKGRMTESKISFSGKNTSLQEIMCSKTSLSISGTATMTKCSFESSTINWDGAFPGDLNFQDCKFNQGLIIWPTSGQIPNYRFLKCAITGQKIIMTDNDSNSKVFEDCEFNDCTVYRLRVDGPTLKNLTFLNCKGYILVTDHRSVKGKFERNDFSEGIPYYKQGELFCIPDKAWLACQKDFNRFLGMIGKG